VTSRFAARAGVAFLLSAVLLTGGFAWSSPSGEVSATSPPSAAAAHPHLRVLGTHVGALGTRRSAPGIRFLTPAGSAAAARVVPSAGAATTSARHPLPVSTDPKDSTAMSAAFVAACISPGRSVSRCNVASLAAIDSARAAEGYGKLTLPAGYASMTMPDQLLYVANAERTSRGLPKFAQLPSLDALAVVGARVDADPAGPNGFTWGSNVAWGYPTALAADFAWMYDDGVGGTNVDCPHAGAAGCWGHRVNILSPWTGRAGVAAVKASGGWVLTELFVNEN
jgi:hypothetical protein